MYCQKCGQKTTRKTKFCTSCGAGLVQPNQNVKSKKTRINKPFATHLSVLIFGSVLAIATVYLVTNKVEPEKNTNTLSIRSRAVLEIAKKFDCLCGNCDHPLEECECTHKNGAVDVKSFIAQKLAEGHLDKHVTEMVQNQYGGRKGKLVFPADSVKILKG
ncbi:MAG: hypothetical protein DWQ05_01345 [Calditrichaeota bacterium]|nr:MAG: hypothetical protein DWQ05_01345 [Calditrichota bacterium]